MANEDEDYFTPQQAVALAKKAEPKTQLLRPGAERYASMNTAKRGSWRNILSEGTTVAVAWTDWEDGFDIINVKTNSVTDRLGNYVIQSKALDIPAAWAYTTLDTFVNRFDEEDSVAISEQSNGKLQNALYASGGASKEEPEDTTEELENDTE